jgi:hypothetical protein
VPLWRAFAFSRLTPPNLSHDAHDNQENFFATMDNHLMICRHAYKISNIGHSRQTAFLKIFMILSIVMGGTIILSVSVASAQTTPVKIGNHDFRPGPPIPSCNAKFKQGPPGDDIAGCRVSRSPVTCLKLMFSLLL